jgi:inorganic pyrophosphatase
MVVEIPKDSTKYEYYDLLALFKLSRALYSPMHYSGDYGLIPGTIAEDHEPLSVSCLVTNRSFTGCLVDVRPIALLHMLNGPEVNHKAVAVPACIEHHVQRELEHFFEIYKELEGRTMPTRSWGDRQTAQKIIRASLDRYLAPRKRLNPDQSRPVITDGGLAS